MHLGTFFVDHFVLCGQAVFGAGGVGKSALTLRYVRDFFVKGWDPTIEDAYMKTVEMDDGSKVQLEILDTAGQGDFQYVTLKAWLGCCCSCDVSFFLFFLSTWWRL